MPRAKVNIIENYQVILDIEISFVGSREYQQTGLSQSLETTRKKGSSFLPYSSVCIYNHVAERSLSDEREVLNNLCSDSD